MTRPMRVEMTLQCGDPDDEDVRNTTGLTDAAYNRLYDAITDAGFEWVTGPDRVE